MAFINTQTTNTNTFKQYVGIMPARILAINPTLAEINEIYGSNSDKEPIYISNKEVDGKTVPSIRIDFIMESVVDSNNTIDTKFKVSFFLSNEFRFNKDKSKVQVMDKYGRTAWVTNEELKSHSIPIYSNGPAKLSSDYSPLYVGEENLTKFIRTYLGIQNIDVYNSTTQSWETNSKPDYCEGRLDEIKGYFDKGDIKELREVIALQPNNKLKVLLGIKRGEERQYQVVFNDHFLSYNAKSTKILSNLVNERQVNGTYKNCYFEICPAKEFIVDTTEFKDSTSEIPVEDDLPMDSTNPFAM